MDALCEEWTVAYPGMHLDGEQVLHTKAEAEGLCRSLNRLKSLGRDDWHAARIGPGLVIVTELE